MQQRHTDRGLYFHELATTCKNYFIPYIQKWHNVDAETAVLEIGCGEGGNLLPFAEIGCSTTGVDIAARRIKEAQHFFNACKAEGKFIAEDIFKLKDLENSYDLIICHDVIEHIDDKDLFMSKIGNYLKADGVVFMSFPTWQMPFGGHQQISKNKILSHLPFVHLLPTSFYKALIKLFGEDEGNTKELLAIKRTGITIERFEKIINHTNLSIKHRELWFINPHYKTKFGLTPRKLPRLLSNIPYFRNYLTSSCFYILSR